MQPCAGKDHRGYKVKVKSRRHRSSHRSSGTTISSTACAWQQVLLPPSQTGQTPAR
jgi:hypothetical protein